MKLSVRNLAGLCAATALIWTGYVRRRTRALVNSECILSIYFHHPSKKEFAFCIRWLQKRGFQFLGVADVDKIRQGTMPFPKGGVLLTVDDGWQSNEENVAALANQYGVPVVIFVSTTPVEEGAYWWSYWRKAQQKGLTKLPLQALKHISEEERLAKVSEIKQRFLLQREALTIEQVKTLSGSNYVTIGGHTDTHPILINCPEEQVYEELTRSRQKLETWTGKGIHYFAYPNGDYGRREEEAVRKLNYHGAFSTRPAYITPELLHSEFTLPRFGFLEGASMAENICRMVGIWKPAMRKLSNLLPLKRPRPAVMPQA